jgi:hypothetical protein
MKNWNFTKKYTDHKTINSNNYAKFEVNWPRGSQITVWAIFHMSRCKLRTPLPIHFKLRIVLGIDSLMVCILFGGISIVLKLQCDIRKIAYNLMNKVPIRDIFVKLTCINWTPVYCEHKSWAFCLDRFLIYSAFCLDRFQMYSAFCLDRFQMYSAFCLDRFLIYSAFCLDRF